MAAHSPSKQAQDWAVLRRGLTRLVAKGGKLWVPSQGLAITDAPDCAHGHRECQSQCCLCGVQLCLARPWSALQAGGCQVSDV